MSLRVAAAAALTLLTACADRCSDQRPDPARPPGQWYRVVVEASPHEVPFFLWLPPLHSAEPALIANGDERISVQHTWSDDGKSVLSFPVFHATVKSEITAGALRGDWEMGAIGKATSFRIAGRAVDRPDPLLRFATSASAAVDIGGVWRVEFERFGVGKGIFRQEPNGVVTGTVLMEAVADLRFMAGVMDGREVLLSTFDGQHAYNMRATVDERGKLSGRLIWPALLEEGFTAERADDVPIDFLNQTKLQPGQSRLTWPQLQKHAGKPVLIDLFGTWCPSCIDMTPLLVEMRNKYRQDGLEIIGIALETIDDAEYAAEQVQRFKKAYGIDWEIVAILGDAEKVAAQLPPELGEVKGLPTTVFVRRDGTVHAIHTGFAGPATGPDHLRVRAEFEKLVKEIVKKE